MTTLPQVYNYQFTLLCWNDLTTGMWPLLFTLRSHEHRICPNMQFAGWLEGGGVSFRNTTGRNTTQEHSLQESLPTVVLRCRSINVASCRCERKLPAACHRSPPWGPAPVHVCTAADNPGMSPLDFFEGHYADAPNENLLLSHFSLRRRWRKHPKIRGQTKTVECCNGEKRNVI